VPNYYEMLGVKPNASQATIKGAFRRLVKEYHPDLNRNRKRWAEAKFKAISEAYKTLSDGVRRLAYDRLVFGGPPAGHPDSSDLYDKLQKDIGFQARRVLADLLNNHGERAVRTYERLCRDVDDFDLLHFMSLKDYLDTKFLLAEAYEAQGHVHKALKFYVDVYKEESEGPRLRYFYDEVRDRIVSIYCRRLARGASPKDAIRYYRKAAEIDQSNASRSQIYKKMAERYYDIDEVDEARRMIEQAFAINPKMKGARRICESLGIPYPVGGDESKQRATASAASGREA